MWTSSYISQASGWLPGTDHRRAELLARTQRDAWEEKIGRSKGVRWRLRG
jgi:hypothetical protein